MLWIPLHSGLFPETFKSDKLQQEEILGRNLFIAPSIFSF